MRGLQHDTCLYHGRSRSPLLELPLQLQQRIGPSLLQRQWLNGLSPLQRQQLNGLSRVKLLRGPQLFPHGPRLHRLQRLWLL